MSENFKKFKRRATLICLLKSVLGGLSLGLAVAGALKLLYNYEMLSLAPLYSALVGAACGLFLAAILFLLLRRGDKRLARQLDDRFSLDEKVQTMLAYKDLSGAILDLQREDADAALASIKTRKFRAKRLWLYITVLVLGVAVLSSSFVMYPEPEPYVPPVEEPFTLTEIQIAALEELITYVETSNMQSPYRESVALAISDLLAELRLITTERERDEALTRALDAILDHTDDSSSAVELMNAIWAGATTESARRLAKLLNYYNWPAADETDAFADALSDFRTTLMHADSISESPDYDKMTTETDQLLRTVATGIMISLTQAGVPTEDSLYVVLARIAAADELDGNGVRVYGLEKIASLSAELGYKNMQSELDSSLALLKSELFASLEQHAANTGTGEYAIGRICTLFEFDPPQLERPNFYETAPDGTLPDGGGDDSGGGGAGIGGETVYGSDDLVLDPITNTYVEYGTIIDKYYALMFSKTEEGDYTDAEKEAMEKYFAILYGGFEE